MNRHPNEKIALEAYLAKHKTLADAADSLGVTKQFLSQIRTGRVGLPDKIADKIGWEWRLEKKRRVKNIALL